MSLLTVGLWFLIKNTRESSYRNWGNGLIDAVANEVVYETKKASDIWDLESIKWDGKNWECVWNSSRKQILNKYQTLEEAKIDFFKVLEMFKSKDDKNELKAALGPTSFETKWPYGLHEFLFSKTSICE